MKQTVHMVDLYPQYRNIKEEIDSGIREVICASSFINGPAVSEFATALGEYLGGCEVIPCANGTDALQIALMSSGLQQGDEVIMPAFSYASAAEVTALLGLVPVFVDVDYDTFNFDVSSLKDAVSSRTRAVIPVHLFGQSCDMEPLLEFAREYQLFVIEDNAQAMGGSYLFSDGRTAKTGTMGDIGCTSFFPTKNLGCFGDGGAVFTTDPGLAEKIRMIANHGQSKKYCHDIIGCNSRLDAIQAAVLKVKLNYLDGYCAARRTAADYYSFRLREFDAEGKFVLPPFEENNCRHVFHQYTLKVQGGQRDDLKCFLADRGIQTMVYYPMILSDQKAYTGVSRVIGDLANSRRCAQSVLSLPIYPEISRETQDMVISAIIDFFEKKSLIC